MSSALKHAVVNSNINNNKLSNQNGIRNRQVIQSRFQYYKLINPQIINYKKTKLFHPYYMHYCMTNFCIKNRKQSILHKHSQNKYLFKHFYLFHFNYTQFTYFASLKIQMQITFAKPFNVLNNAG